MAKPILSLEKKPQIEIKLIETTPAETVDYEIPELLKEDTGSYDDSHISFSANRKHQRSDKQLKDRKRDKHAYLDQYY